MLNFKVVTDTSCNFTKEEIDKNGLIIIPLSIQLDKEVFKEKEDSRYDMVTLAYKINSEKLLPKVINPSVDEFFKIYSSIYPRHGSILSIHTSSGITDVIERAKNTQFLLYDANINLIDLPLVEVGLKPLIIKACNMVANDKSSIPVLISTLYTLSSRFFTFIISDNLNFVLANTNFRGKKPPIFSLNEEKYRYIFSVSGGKLYFIGRCPMNQVIDSITRVMETVVKENKIYIKFLYSLDKEFTMTLSEVINSKFDAETIGLEEMSLSSMCRFGTRSIFIGFSFDEEFFAKNLPIQENIQE
ncbi:MAG: DegV family protein [Caldisericia bacterium]|jgi:DegV family protein with EDD domain|nr:DegV family protein [Caldisericia bacterium]MDD3427704.1 DegV family protein [Caldisericia bacterium]MDD5688932.1 DegV family protein [Caldisericia bacterium]HOJ16549.1 DegV family protein [Caldisericia bacterium]HPO28505.1 DegV family protein [Caldisericia bacterium]